jgi:diguanylate cyclase (GGDEF)-like protein
MWTLPRSATWYVLVIDVLALIFTCICTVKTPAPTHQQWGWFAILTAAAVLHLEAVRTIERRREKAVAGAPYTNLKSLWVCAAVLLIPLPLVVALIVASYVYSWLRVYGQAKAHRKIFSASTFVVASVAASAMLQVGGLTTVPKIPTSLWSLLVVLTAAATWWLVNYALVVGVILLSIPGSTLRKALGDLSDQLVVAAALGLGIAAAALIADHPWVLPVLAVTVLCVHRDLLLPQFQRAARTDAKTGLAAPTYWAEVVKAELLRAKSAGTSVGVLMLDLDHFSDINNVYGHPAGDEALTAIARAVLAEVRRDDLVARFGGDELAIVLPDIDPIELLAVAERIRAALGRPIILSQTLNGGPETVTGMTATIGAAVFPQSGQTYEQLLLAADTQLYGAKNAGRNQVRLSPAHDTPS